MHYFELVSGMRVELRIIGTVVPGDDDNWAIVWDEAIAEDELVSPEWVHLNLLKHA